MAVIYEVRGRATELSELGLNLYSGCAVGCRYCSDAWLRSMTWEKWTKGARPRRDILFLLNRDARKMEGDPREITVCPASDPYQSDEAARLTRKALFILEQYHLRVQVMTVCGMRSTADFDILARNRWKYSTLMLFQSETMREQWEPGAAPIAERAQAIREAHAAGIFTWVNIDFVPYPAELIDLVESLRADVNAWKIGRPPAGEPPLKAIAGGRPGFVDTDTALAHLRRMVARGLSDKLRRTDDMTAWSPEPTDKAKSGGPGMDEPGTPR